MEQEYGIPLPNVVDRREKFGNMKSMSTESRVSTESSSSQQVLVIASLFYLIVFQKLAKLEGFIYFG